MIIIIVILVILLGEFIESYFNKKNAHHRELIDFFAKLSEYKFTFEKIDLISNVNVTNKKSTFKQIIEHPIYGKIFLMLIIFAYILFISFITKHYGKEKLPNEKFYLFISILIVLIIAIYPQRKIEEKVKTTGLTLFLTAIGLINILISITLFNFLNDQFEIFGNLNVLVDNSNLTNKEQFKNYSNFFLIVIISFILFTYFIYATLSLIIKMLFNKKSWYDFCRKLITMNHTQLVNEFTIFLVVFGFLPLAIEIFSIDKISKVAHVKGEDIRTYFNQNVLVWFLACVIPYAYLLNNSPKEDEISSENKSNK